MQVAAKVTGAVGDSGDRKGPLEQAFARVVGLVKEDKVPEATTALDVFEAALRRMAGEPAAAAT